LVLETVTGAAPKAAFGLRITAVTAPAPERAALAFRAFAVTTPNFFGNRTLLPPTPEKRRRYLGRKRLCLVLETATGAAPKAAFGLRITAVTAPAPERAALAFRAFADTSPNFFAPEKHRR
jgi:hypothetical protein